MRKIFLLITFLLSLNAQDNDYSKLLHSFDAQNKSTILFGYESNNNFMFAVSTYLIDKNYPNFYVAISLDSNTSGKAKELTLSSLDTYVTFGYRWDNLYSGLGLGNSIVQGQTSNDMLFVLSSQYVFEDRYLVGLMYKNGEYGLHNSITFSGGFLF